VTNNYYEGTIEGEALLTNCNFKQTNLCEMQKTVLDFDLNYANNIISINSALIDTDGADMSISGKVSLTDSITTDLIIDAPKLDIEELTKYAPPKLLSEYGIEETTGILQLNGTIIGCVSDSTLPNIAINFGLKNGTFSMKDHPPLKNLSFNGIYNNGALCNSQSTNLSINAFTFNTPQSQGRLDLSLQNLDSPQYSATLLFEGDLEELSNYYIPDSLLNPLTGQIDALISTNGQLPDPIDSTFILCLQFVWLS
jgi:hypothetical protein